MVLNQAVEQTLADSPSKPALSRSLSLVRRAIDERRAAMRGLLTASSTPSSLEHAFLKLVDEVRPGLGIELRIFAQGKPRALNPVIQEQLFLIGREAVMNAFRIPTRQRSRLRFNTGATCRACSFVTTAVESNLKPFKERVIRTGVSAECAAGRKISVRNLKFGAG
jgi:signal transduction histidine kinase